MTRLTLALAGFLAIAACIDPWPPEVEEEPVQVDTLLAVTAFTASPQRLTVAKGDRIDVSFSPSSLTAMEAGPCVTARDREWQQEWQWDWLLPPLCADLTEDDGWLVLELDDPVVEWMRKLEADCEGSGHPTARKIGFKSCFSLLKIGRFEGPGITNRVVTGCPGETWYAKRFKSYHGSRTWHFPRHHLFEDTARVTITC